MASHQDLMSKVEKLHLLEDSNRLLRDENTQLSSKLAEVQARASSLEKEVDPLRQKTEQYVCEDTGDEGASQARNDESRPRFCRRLTDRRDVGCLLSTTSPDEAYTLFLKWQRQTGHCFI